ncbi:unnamed protein product [Arabis nemorensis]|uniref:Uncharacterized protein n=1 Tax=Arabis nemorensis TaxID=586526 RepID=A0A565CSX5_9BRAS|nr:unnamed protein product [Arabis nemorensis]
MIRRDASCFTLTTVFHGAFSSLGFVNFQVRRCAVVLVSSQRNQTFSPEDPRLHR